MRQLRFVGLAEDGASLVLESPTGESYRLPVDERVRAACRGDLTRLGQIQFDMDNPLPPREIQARVRAGESAEEVAASSGMPLDRVLRFAYPVLQERSRVVAQARTTPVRPPADQQLGDLVEERLVSRGTDAATLAWDAWRREDGRWAVRLGWRHGDSAHAAHWSLDLGRRAVQPEDPAAEQLSAAEFHARTITAVTPLAVAARQAGGRGGTGTDARTGVDPRAGSGRTDRTAPPSRPEPGRPDRGQGEPGRSEAGQGQPGRSEAGRGQPGRLDRGQPDRGRPAAQQRSAPPAPSRRTDGRGAGRDPSGRTEANASGVARDPSARTEARGEASGVGQDEAAEGRPRRGVPPAPGGRPADPAVTEDDSGEDGEAAEGQIAAGGGTVPLVDVPHGEDDRGRRATVPSWDDILLGVRRRH